MAETGHLRRLQQRFFALVTAREDVPGALARLGWATDVAEAMVTGDARLGAVDRIGIYNDMYFFRLLGVIEQDFPVLAQVLGEEAFRGLVAEYLEAFPPRDHALRDLARGLPAFIAGHELAGQRPWLADLTALEWARADLFDRADAVALSHADLQSLPAEQFASLHLQTVPASSILDLGFAVDDLWRARAAADPGARSVLEPPPAAPARLQLLLWRDGRDGTDVFHRRASADETGLLPALLAGTTFGALCEQLGQGRSIEQAAQLAFQLLAGWIQAGLLRAANPGA